MTNPPPVFIGAKGEGLLARQVDGDVGDLFLGELDAGGLDDGRSHLLREGILGTLPDLIQLGQVHGHVAAVLHAQESNGDVDEQVLVRDGIDLEVLALGHALHAGRDRIDELDTLDVADVRGLFAQWGVARSGLVPGAHDDARQAHAPCHLGSRDADPVMRALLQREAEMGKRALDALEVVGDRGTGHEDDLGELIKRDPIRAHQQVVEQVGHALLRRLRKLVRLQRLGVLHPCLESGAVRDGKQITAAPLQVDAGEAGHGVVGLAHVVADAPHAHAEMIGDLRRHDAGSRRDIFRKRLVLHAWSLPSHLTVWALRATFHPPRFRLERKGV